MIFLSGAPYEILTQKFEFGPEDFLAYIGGYLVSCEQLDDTLRYGGRYRLTSILGHISWSKYAFTLPDHCELPCQLLHIDKLSGAQK